MKNWSVVRRAYQGLDAVHLHLPDGDEAIVTLAGAHVVSWKTAGGVERIFMSPKSMLKSGQAIRGGVPVIFPQFTTRGASLRHGFARVSEWTVLPGESDEAQVTLELNGEGTAWNWPHAYACAMTFTLKPDEFSMQLTVRNPAQTPFTFTAALHTYLCVGAIDSVVLDGLSGCMYEDSRDGGTLKQDHAALLKPREALDRIYLQTPRALQLHTAMGNVGLHSTGFPDTVVWNPGPEGCAALADLAADSYQHFLCVEAALVGKPFTLESGATWTGSQTLRVLPQ